jgi:hypothetical protein
MVAADPANPSSQTLDHGPCCGKLSTIHGVTLPHWLPSAWNSIIRLLRQVMPDQIRK